ncbi:diacylglycerol/lipid kinase family protein [Kozakia baliensis]|uniref:diacylglycerol/lipid kinase family protein n=1 Tax=Kozakia baliensis TaxID=153496 RepID=UPI000A817F8F|nr:acylglycerol kinase family protein [Kozakia baliensis]
MAPRKAGLSSRHKERDLDNINDAPVRLALIHNPRSRRNRRDGKAFVRQASAWLGDGFLQPQSHEEMEAMIRRLAARKTPLIAINGGDGTVSDVLTRICHAYPADALPRIAIFPSGNTNLIAKDVGFQRRGLAALKQLMEETERLGFIIRAPLQVSWPDESQPSRLGMFHGSTGYARAIAIAHSPHVLRYAPHDLAVGVTLLATFGSLARRRQRETWLNGDPARLETAEGVIADGRSFLFIATALHHLNRGIWPFWRKQSDAQDGLHFLNVKDHPTHLVRATWSLLRGRAENWLRQSPDYASGCVQDMWLHSPSDFVLDGEVLSPGEGGVIKLSRGPRFTFLHD